MKSEQRKEQVQADQTVKQLESDREHDRIHGDEAATHELGQRLRDLPDDDDGAETDHDLRARLVAQFDEDEKIALPERGATASASKWSRGWAIAASLLAIGVLAGMLIPPMQTVREAARRSPTVDSDWWRNVESEVTTQSWAVPGEAQDGKRLATGPHVAAPQQGRVAELGFQPSQKLPPASYTYDDAEYDANTTTLRVHDLASDLKFPNAEEWKQKKSRRTKQSSLRLTGNGRSDGNGEDTITGLSTGLAPPSQKPSGSPVNSRSEIMREVSQRIDHSDWKSLQPREDLAYTNDLLSKANNKIVVLVDGAIPLDGARTPVQGKPESERFRPLLKDVRNRFENRYIAQQERLKELLSNIEAPVLVGDSTIHHVKITELGQKIEKAKAEAAKAYSDRERVLESLKRGDDAAKEMVWTLVNEAKISNQNDIKAADRAPESIQTRLQNLEIARIEKIERYGSTHPQVKSVDRQIAHFEGLLETAVEPAEKDKLLLEKKGGDPKEVLKSYVATLNDRIVKNQVVIRDSMEEYAIHDAEAMKLAAKERQIVDARRKMLLAKEQLMAEMGVSNAEQYEPIVENPFIDAIGGEAISTFSIDVDTASYANMRRFINNGQLPPPNAVRLEELINYFSYDYEQPKGDDPFSMNLELASCPWHDGRQLLRVGLQGKDVHVAERPATNVVFLIDVSGSMQNQNKLPLLKRGFQMMVDQLGEDDRVSIVTYAGNAGVALNPTSGDQKQVIKDAIEKLTPGGSTHGSAGIELAYRLAQQNFIHKGSNKVILATDGDLNVGVTNDDQLVNLIKGKAAEGVFLTVLGFGTGNLKDGKLEKLADNGNGVYSYIDSLREAHKVLVEQLSGSLLTIAKDVKIQIEFNPAEVKSYRLLGYENRALETKDFDDDRKDAGEIGAGHSVTAIYEIVPAKLVKAQTLAVPVGMKYQIASSEKSPSAPADQLVNLSKAAKSGELATVAVRYKEPTAQVSRRLDFTIANEEKSFSAASDDFRFASSVAGFGMLLRGSEFSGDASLTTIEAMAANAVSDDESGYRSEFVDLVRKAAGLLSNRR